MTANKSSFDGNHRIGRLDVVASIHDLDNAMAYRPRLESLAWEKFPDVIEGVFDKFASPDAIFRMDKLELDLGTIRPAFLETDAIAALERALEEALASAIHDAKNSKRDDRHLVDTSVWRLQQMETFLCEGRPGSSVDLTGFDPAAEMIWLLDNEPDAFLAMVDRRAGHAHALERLSLQISDKGREILVKRLAPSQSADIIGLMKDMEELLAGLPAASPRIAGAILQQKFRVHAIVCLLQARGSSYDLQRLLTRILGNLAEQMNIFLPEILSSISDARSASGRRSFRYSDLDEVWTAMISELGGDENAMAVGEVANMAAFGIEQWRKLFNRQRSSGPEEQLSFSGLTKRQFEALLKAWAPDDLILDKRNVLTRLLSQAGGAAAAVEDQIGKALFEYIAAHIDEAADHVALWEHVVSAIRPTSDFPGLVAEIVQMLLSDSSIAEREIAVILDRAVGQDATLVQDRLRSGHRGRDTGQVGREFSAVESKRFAQPNDIAENTLPSRLKSDIATALTGGSNTWLKFLRKYAWTADEKTILFEMLPPKEFGAIIKRVFENAEIAAAIVDVFSSDSASVEREIAAILHRAVNQGVATSEQSSGNREHRGKAGREQPVTPIAKSERSSQNDGGTPHSRLRADIMKAMESRSTEWRRLLHEYAQTANDRKILSDILSSNEFESLLVAMAGDPAMPVMQRAFQSAISKSLGMDVTAPIKAELLEYLTMQGDGPLQPEVLWQHVLFAVVPADAIRSKIIEGLLHGKTKVEQDLAALLADDPGHKSKGTPSHLRNLGSKTGTPTHDAAGPGANHEINEAALDHSDVVRRLLANPEEWRALLRTYAQNAEERTRLLAAISAAQFESLIQMATGDPKASATLRAFLSAISEAIGADAEAHLNAAILEYLAAHDSSPVDIAALWMRSLEAVFPSAMPATEKSAKSEKIFDLLPYEDAGLAPEIFDVLAAVAGQKTASRPKPDQSASQSLTDVENADFIGSALASDDQSLLEKLRAAIPHPPSISPFPGIRFGNDDFETIIRRLRPTETVSILAGIKAILGLQKSRPFLPMHHDRLAELVRYLVLANLIWEPRGRIDPGPFWEVMIDHLAKTANLPVHSLASRLQSGFLEGDSEDMGISALQKASSTLAKQHKSADSHMKMTDDSIAAELADDGDPAGIMHDADPSLIAQDKIVVLRAENAKAAKIAPSDREAVTAYLMSGDRPQQSDSLVRAAQQHPAWLAKIARKSVSSTTSAKVVAERMLFCLTPPSILNFLAPQLAKGLVDKAPKSGDADIWWTDTIATLLVEKTRPPDAARSVAEKPVKETADGRSQATVTDNDDPDEGMLYKRAIRSAQDQDSVSSFENEPSVNINLSDRRTLTAYLEKGNRQEHLEILVHAAKQDPAWLAGLARKTASSTADATTIAARLLYWLMPGEILQILAPALASALLQSAPKSGDDGDWWADTIAALLLGEVPYVADIIERDISPVPYFDRLASLQDWLDGGDPPENAAEQFLRLTQAERISLLRADTVDATLQRLYYALATLGLEKTETLLQGIIGWAALKKGPLAALIGENKVDQHGMLLRAAAASLVSTEIDLNILADPLPAFSDANQMDARGKPEIRGSDGFGVSDLIEWLDGKPVNRGGLSQLRAQFDHLIDSQDSRLLNYISSHFYQEERRSRWVGCLPEASLGRLLYLIVPNDARTLHDGIMLLTTAASQLLTSGSPPVDRHKLWISVFDAVARPKKVDLPGVLADLVSEAADGDGEKGLERKIRARAVALAGDGDHITVAAALRRSRQPEAEQYVASPSAKPSGGQGLEDFENDNIREEEEEASGRPVYIANAGLILINPFLPAFFERLDLLSRDENDKPYIDSEPAASRAMHLLQYLVTGQTASPEPLLFLNKIICGLSTGTPVASSIEPDPKDIEICNGLLEGILENWPALHGTSVDGLRETFMQREGRLNYDDQKWSLVIQRKTLDILKDQIPWNTSVIFHPWMNDPIHTTW